MYELLESGFRLLIVVGHQSLWAEICGVEEAEAFIGETLLTSKRALCPDLGNGGRVRGVVPTFPSICHATHSCTRIRTPYSEALIASRIENGF